MDNTLAAKCILSGILDGNERLERWTGGQWICHRGSTEYVLVSGVADRIHDRMHKWHVWPETEAADDFNYIGTNYHKCVNDRPPREVFGGVRYDLGLLRSSRIISALVEIKRYWTTDDLTKLALALFYLGKKPQPAQNDVKEGVLLESVFFGAFVWHNPSGKYANEPLETQYDKIGNEIHAWWERPTTGGAASIQEQFETKYSVPPQPKIETTPKAEIRRKGQLEAGAVCVYLSLDESP